MKASSSRIQLAVFALLVALMVMSVALPAAAQAPRPMRFVQGEQPVGERGEPVPTVDLSGAVRQADGRVQVIVTLAGTPAVADYIAAGGRSNRAAALGMASIREAQLRADQSVFAAGASSLGATVVNSSAFLVNTVTVAIAPDQVAALQRLPGVVSVHANLIFQRDDTTSIPLIGAPEVWEVAGWDGAGIVIGIVDTGIDYIHTHFGGTGDNNDNPDSTDGTDSLLFPAANPTAYGDPKVVGGYDYVGDAYDASNPAASTPVPDEDPADCAVSLGGGHGSHVAGTAAGYGVNNIDGSTYTGPMDTTYYPSFPNPTAALRIGPGVAPGASLVALRVFGCDGSSASDVIISAFEDAVTGAYPTTITAAQDPVDVINMSLGSSYGNALADDPYSIAIDNATAAGVVIVTSAGNSGNVPLITGAPGSANSALSVSNSTDTSALLDARVVHSSGLGSPANYPAAAAQFNNPAALPFTDTVVVAQPLNGCSALTNAAEIAGNIALIQRGACTFEAKANNALAAGATGLIVFGNPGDQTPITMAGSPTSTLPALMIGNANGLLLKASYDDAIANTTALPSVTLELFEDPSNFVSEVPDTLVSSSSRGGIVPSPSDITLKPNVTAPGNSITSARAGSGDKVYVIGGTSMASPHVAGYAALLRHAYPTASVADIKAMIMNTANNDVFTGALNLPPQHVGTGRVDVVDGFATDVIAYATDNPENVALSFGYPHVLTGTVDTQTKSVTVKNLSTTDAYTFDIAYVVRSDHPLVEVSVPASVTVAANSTATFDVEFETNAANAATNISTYLPTAGNNSPMPEEAGILVLTEQVAPPRAPGSQPDLRVPVYGMPQTTADMDATIDFGNNFYGVNAQFNGTGVDTSGVGALGANIVSLATLSELVAVDPAGDQIGSNGSIDITHVGITSDVQVSPGPNSQVYFSIATADEWAAPGFGDSLFQIYIDEDFDGVEDFIVANTYSSSSFQVGIIDVNGVYSDPGSFLTYNAPFTRFVNGFAGSNINTMHRKNNVIVLPFYLYDIAITGAFDFWVESFNRWDDVASDAVGSASAPFTFDPAAQSYYFNDLNGQAGGPYVGIPAWYDLDGYAAPIDILPGADLDNLPQILVLHHHNTDKATRVDVLDAPVLAQGFELVGPPNGAYVRDTAAITAVTWSDDLSGSAVTYRWILTQISTNTRLGTVLDLPGLTPEADTDDLTCDGTLCTLTVDPLIAATLPDGQFAWTVTADDVVNGTIEAANGPYFFTIETNDIDMVVNGGFEDCVAKVAAPWIGTGCKLDAAKAYAGDGYFNGKPGKKVVQAITHPAVATLGAEDVTLGGYFDAKAAAGNIAVLKVKYVDPAGGANSNGKDKLKLKFTTDSVGYEMLSDTLSLTGPVKSVKVIVGSGLRKIKADDVSLVVAGPNGPAPRGDGGGVLPPPAAPDGFRGNN